MDLPVEDAPAEGPRVGALLDGLDDDMGLTRDPRAGDALDVVRRKRLKNGRWRGSEMITLNALRAG